MCLMLYLAADSMLAEQTMGELSVEATAPELEAALGSALSKPCRRFLGVGGGCSCDFPHCMDELPPECFESALGAEDEPGRQQQMRLIAALRDLVAELLQADAAVEIYATWAGREATAPSRRVDLRLADLAPESFCFIEQWLYVVRR